MTVADRHRRARPGWLKIDRRSIYVVGGGLVVVVLLCSATIRRKKSQAAMLRIGPIGPAPPGARRQQPLAARAARKKPRVHFLRWAPDILVGERAPHGNRGACRSCHQVLTRGLLPVAGARPRRVRPTPGQKLGRTNPPTRRAAGTKAPGKKITMLPFQEVHWQGIEMISTVRALKRRLDIPVDARGVVIDEVTPPADQQGFWAGDLITAINGRPTPTLEAAVTAARTVHDKGQVTVSVLRKGKPRKLQLYAVKGILGTANGESAPMIRSGARPPHGWRGPCTNCHRIGKGPKLPLPVDLGDLLVRKAPPIRVGQKMPHRNRGVCSACHKIIR